MKRFLSLVCAAGATAAIAVAATAGAASADSPLPTLNVALQGANGVSVSGSEVSGAVNVAATFQGSLPRNSNGPSFALVELNPGATFQQAFAAVQAAHGDIDAITPYATMTVSGGPGSVQATLTPGNWLALNVSGNGQPGVAPFTVTQAATPAALPAPTVTETAIEFGFRGPATIHDGAVLRTVNDGYLVHMIQFIGVKSKAAGLKGMALLRAGKDNQAGQYFTHSFFGMGPVTHGGMEQQTVNAKPGYYVEACFMDTQDGREHTRLGMVRLVKVVQ